LRIATDYNGATAPTAADIVTMNGPTVRITRCPRSKNSHVLHRLGLRRTARAYAMRVGDVYIRNVPTDIRRYWGRVPAAR